MKYQPTIAKPKATIEDGWKDRHIGGRTDSRTDGQLNRCSDGWIFGRLDGRTNGQMVG